MAEDMRLVVVEPHCDDAFLSVGGLLQTLFKDWDKTIVTVYADRRRGEEAGHYAKSIGAKSIVMYRKERDMLSKGDSKESIKYDKETTNLLSKLMDELDDWDSVLFPIGLQHPDHITVARVGAKYPEAWYYLEIPYQSKQKLTKELNDRIEDMQIVHMQYPNKSKWKSIGIFKSQAKFFHFNKVLEDSRVPEILVQRVEYR